MKPFLDPIEEDSLEFRGPVHTGCEIRWLIDRQEAFQEIEEAVAAAQRTVHLAGWVFLTQTPILSSSVKSMLGSGASARETTWLDLIRFTVTKKSPAVVRLMPSDFDAFFYSGNHRLCWKTIRDLAEVSLTLDAAHEDNLQFFPSLHGAVTGLLSSPLLAAVAPTLGQRIVQAVEDYNRRSRKSFRAALKLYAQTPGHWSSITPDPKTKRFAVSSSPKDVVHVGSHHQKIVIVDGEIGFCGGMDPTPLALNDRRHKLRRRHGSRKRFDLLWHDVHCRLRGPAVFDMERNFRHRWETERQQLFERLNLELIPNIPAGGLPILFFPAMRDRPKPSATAKGTVQAQIHRTVSSNDATQTFKTLRRDVLDSYERAIEGALRYVYIENQYLRSRDLARALIARHKKNPRLQVVVVLPVAPEELTDAAAGDPLVLQPIAIQNEVIDDLRAELGSNIGFFSLVARFKSRKKSLTHEAGSPQVYVHSKVLIVDDVFASIGSANANGRSFYLDSEINVGWRHESVRSFRIDLWRELLGLSAAELGKWKPEAFVLSWRKVAEENLRLPPGRRSGFVVPHNHEKLKKIAKPLALPESLEAFLAIANPSEPGLSPELLDADVPDRVVPDVQAVS